MNLNPLVSARTSYNNMYFPPQLNQNGFHGILPLPLKKTGKPQRIHLDLGQLRDRIGLNMFSYPSRSLVNTR